MIRVEKLCKSFTSKGNRVSALEDVSFDLPAGEILGVVGKSGAGKTTLLRLLSLQTRPSSGRITLLEQVIKPGMSPQALRAMVQQSATVFQGFSLLYNRSVLDNAALPLKLRGVESAAREAKAREMLRFVGLEHHAESFPITLSGGEAQRVAIARALVTDPKILFLDEPTSALDGQTSKDILDLLRKSHAAYGMSIVLISHQIEVVRYMCDRVLHLEEGRVKRLGPISRSAAFAVNEIEQIWAGADV